LKSFFKRPPSPSCDVPMVVSLVKGIKKGPVAILPPGLFYALKRSGVLRLSKSTKKACCYVELRCTDAIHFCGIERVLYRQCKVQPIVVRYPSDCFRVTPFSVWT